MAPDLSFVVPFMNEEETLQTLVEGIRDALTPLGKNLTSFGNDPEHINHFRHGSLARLLSTHFEVLEQRQSYPCMLALTRPR